MNNSTVMNILAAAVFIILVIVAVKFAIRVLLPISIIIIAAYIVYIVVAGRRW